MRRGLFVGTLNGIEGGHQQDCSCKQLDTTATPIPPSSPLPMSTPCLLEELLDYVVDFLHNAPRALENCCLVSKSWIPRARMHLFAHVAFSARGLQSWKKLFPDPSTSPACYTKTLHLLPSRGYSCRCGGGWLDSNIFSRRVLRDC